MGSPQGYLCLVLHAHLPYVRHPEFDNPLEEYWFREAVTECYLPLLGMMQDLVNEGVRFRLTFSITPPLAAMLSDKLLCDRYALHLEKMLELADKEVFRTKQMPEFHRTALHYQQELKKARLLFDRCGGNLIGAFSALQEAGYIEIITCSATHGFLPLMQQYPNAVRAQVAIGCKSYEDHFGRPPRGMWNAECAYYPGLDRILGEENIQYCFVDTHGLLHADRRPVHGVFAPLLSPNGVAAFGRDVESSKSVWSAEEGYPGDFRYREFYRDIGYDLPKDYIGPFIHESGLRMSTGFKYFRVTGQRCNLADKQPYHPDEAMALCEEHAGNFFFNRERQVEYLAQYMDRPPIIVSPYDAELFGHWWYEGPQFLGALLRRIHYGEGIVKTITPSEYLERHPRNQVATPSLSSWGHKGYCEVWLEGSNDWIYRHLHKAAERMIDLANSLRTETDPVRVRMLNQAARELLLAQSSDWAFIMKTQTMVDYAVKRTKDHILQFQDLWRMLKDGTCNLAYLEELEHRDSIFPDIDFRIYTDPH